MHAHKQAFKKLKRDEKTQENTIVQKSLLATRFMIELQKLLGSFPFFITYSSLHGNYG